MSPARRVAAKRLFALAPFFLMALVLGLVTVWFEHERAIGGAQMPVGDFAVRLARAGVALAFYFWKCLWPVELMPVYPRWAVDPPALYQFSPWLGLMLAAGWLWRRRGGFGRHVLFTVSFFVLNLLPVLGFVAIGYMHASWVADHFAYISLLGFAGGIAAIVEWASTKLPAMWRRFGAAALLVKYCSCTMSCSSSASWKTIWCRTRCRKVKVP